MSRTLALVLFSALLVLPAFARADARLSLKVLQLSMLQSTEPTAVAPPRVPLAIRAREAVERLRSRILSLDTILGRVELHAPERPVSDEAQPCQLAVLSSAPAGVFTRGPAVSGPRVLRTPRFAF